MGKKIHFQLLKALCFVNTALKNSLSDVVSIYIIYIFSKIEIKLSIRPNRDHFFLQQTFKFKFIIFFIKENHKFKLQVLVYF